MPTKTPEEQAALDAVAAIEGDATKTLDALAKAKADNAKAQADLAVVVDQLAGANVLNAAQSATLAEVAQRLVAVDGHIDDAVPDENIPVTPAEPTPVEDLPPANP